MSKPKPLIHFLKLQNTPIYEQLQIEEALLRADDRNWCLINEGSSPAIVMGISGKPEVLIDQEMMKKHPLPLIKRFTGGGTVVVDESTYFVSFIMNGSDIHVASTPKDIFVWSETFYRPVFKNMDFALNENDYVIGQKKFGGNAQYIRKERWLHHTSFLWDFNSELMNYLLMPSKRPKYREERAHLDFLCRLHHYMEKKSTLEERIMHALTNFFVIHISDVEEIAHTRSKSHRQSTLLITHI